MSDRITELINRLIKGQINFSKGCVELIRPGTVEWHTVHAVLHRIFEGSR